MKSIQFIHDLLRLGKTPPTPADSSFPPVVASTQFRLEVGWATHVGKVRHHNEDTALVITTARGGDVPVPAFGIFIMADGMGGQKAGEVASSLAARAVAHHVMHQFYLPTLVSQEYDASQSPLNEVLVEAVQVANTAVANQVPGGGTTLTCALMLGPRAYIAHVGDSRAYIVAEEGLDQVTHDHSLVDRLVELGQLTHDEAAVHPHKNVLYRAVGQSGVLEVDTYMRTIPPGGHLLLCSDGLWGMVSEAQITDIVTTASSLQAACDSLVAAANRAGGADNITAILLGSPPS